MESIFGKSSESVGKGSGMVGKARGKKAGRGGWGKKRKKRGGVGGVMTSTEKINKKIKNEKTKKLKN